MIASSEKQVARAETLAEKRRVRRRDAVRRVMDSESGRLFLAALIAECGVMDGGFTPDPYRLQFDAGRRNFGLKLIAELEATAPKGFVLMQDEQATRARDDRREDEAAAKVAAQETVDGAV